LVIRGYYRKQDERWHYGGMTAGNHNFLLP
jgi:hypothetical protein